MKDIFVIENMIQLGNAEEKKIRRKINRKSRGNKRKIKRNK